MYYPTKLKLMRKNRKKISSEHKKAQLILRLAKYRLCRKYLVSELGVGHIIEKKILVSVRGPTVQEIKVNLLNIWN